MTVHDFLSKLFGTASSEEEFGHLEQWKKEGIDNAKVLQEMLDIHDHSNELQHYKSYDVEQALSANLNRIQDRQVTNSKPLKYVLYVLLGLLLAAGVYIGLKPKAEHTSYYAETQKQLSIENGTQISMNEETHITYHNKENYLKLEGEAFFDVEKQKTPFIIETHHGEITVLGTSFNVKTSDLKTTIYMHEGTIRFDKDGKETKLTAGQLCEVTDEISVKVQEDSQLIDYWRTHALTYKNTPLTNVLADVNRLHGTSLRIDGENTSDILITSSFENNSLEEIVEILEAITNVDIK